MIVRSEKSGEWMKHRISLRGQYFNLSVASSPQIGNIKHTEQHNIMVTSSQNVKALQKDHSANQTTYYIVYKIQKITMNNLVITVKLKKETEKSKANKSCDQIYGVTKLVKSTEQRKRLCRVQTEIINVIT